MPRTKEQFREYVRARRAANPERYKAEKEQSLNKIRIRKYGIDTDEVNKRVKNQGGCAICGAQEAGGRGDWHVDHDHRTNQIRGILCAYCNMGLGSFKDNVERLEQAIYYLVCGEYLPRSEKRRKLIDINGIW